MSKLPVRWAVFQVKQAYHCFASGARERGWRAMLPHLPELPRRFARAARWMHAVTRGPTVRAAAPVTCGVVLLSYQRPANIEMIARGFLKCAFVDQVVISNNNPSVRLRDWVAVADPRLVLLDQPAPTRQGIRLRLLAELRAPITVTVDDDRFLFPDQIRKLVEEVHGNPAAPHGFEGEKVQRSDLRSPAGDYPFDTGVTGTDTVVDTLTGGYFLTADQARTCLDTTRRLGIADLGRFGNGEDLVMSRSGRAPARVHDVGPVLQCWTTSDDEIATWRRGDFFAERLRLRAQLAGLGLAGEPAT